MRPIQYGKIKKLGPGRYRVVWPPKRGPKPGKGRPPGRKKRIPKSQQTPGVPYCSDCNRELNANNTTGLCGGCASHKTQRIPDGP